MKYWIFLLLLLLLSWYAEKVTRLTVTTKKHWEINHCGKEKEMESKTETFSIDRREYTQGFHDGNQDRLNFGRGRESKIMNPSFSYRMGYRRGCQFKDERED